MKKTKNHAASGLSRRLHFSEEEKRLVWLPMLLDAYAIADTGVAVAIRNREKREGKKLACGKGCGSCCVHQTDLPLYPHEIVGIYWYATEKLSGPDRDRLRERLAAPAPGQGCPFLVNESCAIHPLRPVGCRQFNVFTTRCGPGEDPYFTRNHDVLRPDQEYLDRVFTAVLPFYHLTAADAASAVRMVRSQIMNLLSYDWSKLAGLMDRNAGG